VNVHKRAFDGDQERVGVKELGHEVEGLVTVELVNDDILVIWLETVPPVRTGLVLWFPVNLSWKTLSKISEKARLSSPCRAIEDDTPGAPVSRDFGNGETSTLKTWVVLDEGLGILFQELLVRVAFLKTGIEMTIAIVRLLATGEPGFFTHLYGLPKTTLELSTIVLSLLMGPGTDLPVGSRGDLLEIRETLWGFKDKISLVVGGVVFTFLKLINKVGAMREPRSRVTRVGSIGFRVKVVSWVV